MATSSFLESISPWGGSRAATPSQAADGSSPVMKAQQGGDHHINSRHRINPKNYSDDCPPLNPRWFYAVDGPKRKPDMFVRPGDKPPTFAPPKKYAPFSAGDSKSIEQVFQKLAEENEKHGERRGPESRKRGRSTSALSTSSFNTNMTDDEHDGNPEAKVPVNEDYLFDVDVDKRELAPAYWLGPVYDVRRATWFYQDASASRPCDENLAMQLEEGYIKTKPWRLAQSTSGSRSRAGSVTQKRSRPTSWAFGLGSTPAEAPDEEPKPEAPSANLEAPAPETAPTNPELPTYRLFGTYMNSVVTYQDQNTAWLLTDDFYSRMSSTVYSKIAGGGHFGGVKVVRGYSEAKKEKDKAKEAKEADAAAGTPEKKQKRSQKGHARRSSAPPTSRSQEQNEEEQEPESVLKRSALERRMAGLVNFGTQKSAAAQEQEVRELEESEIRDDYREKDGDNQDREIEHLVLVTHGIGQRLGMKMESLNFIHDVNVLRKTLKNVYEKSPDLQALNNEVEKLPKNCRIQVLPIVWRHKLDFPEQSFKEKRKERDLSDIDRLASHLAYPKLKDITVEGVPAIRNLIEDLFLDILLYQSGYREHIAGIVHRECNRVYKLFRQRNPNFNGKVSLIGHSLGSAIFFDLLSRQKADAKPSGLIDKVRPRRSGGGSISGVPDLWLDFNVEDLYCLGSPIGLFQMLQGKTIAGRHANDLPAPESRSWADSLLSANIADRSSPLADLPFDPTLVSSPKCNQLYNIFHPTDPIAYRIEPLISPVMKALKPQQLPSVKRGLFGAQVPGLSGIGVRMGQGVVDLWSNITTGMASSLLNRSLGLVNEPPSQSQQGGQLGQDGTIAIPGSEDDLANAGLEHPNTLIDGDIETLYSGFQARQNRSSSGAKAGGEEVGQQAGSNAGGKSDGKTASSASNQEAEERARQYRREEAKVRALNRNGRVDYSIQENFFDISLIASIASHLSYWADEDFNHFMISQLLARQRLVKKQTAQ